MNHQHPPAAEGVTWILMMYQLHREDHGLHKAVAHELLRPGVKLQHIHTVEDQNEEELKLSLLSMKCKKMVNFQSQNELKGN